MKVYVIMVEYSSAFRDSEVLGVFASKDRARQFAERWALDWDGTTPTWSTDELVTEDWVVSVVEQDLKEEGLFFTYRQNNSGGRYEFNDNLSAYVIIEAKSPEEANKRAEELGIEFDEGCSTCGDRWDRADEWDSEEIPMIYNKDVSKGLYKESGWARRQVPVAGYIHYYDRKETINWG